LFLCTRFSSLRLRSGRRPDKSRSWNFINHFREDHPEWTSLPGIFLKEPNFLALGSGKSYHPMLPPAYDGKRSWSPEALPYENQCINTADLPKAKFQDGGLPCFPCPIDIEHYLHVGDVNVSVINEMCEIDAYEDTLTIDGAIRKMKHAVSAGKHFYLAVGMHKVSCSWQSMGGVLVGGGVKKRVEGGNVEEVVFVCDGTPYDSVALGAVVEGSRHVCFPSVHGVQIISHPVFVSPPSPPSQAAHALAGSQGGLGQAPDRVRRHRAAPVPADGRARHRAAGGRGSFERALDRDPLSQRLS
jgi:hypothetical protein